MNAVALEAEIAKAVPQKLAGELVAQFVSIRRDVVSGTLERAAPGKFVESVVQALQYMEQGSFDSTPAVDTYLRALDSRASTLDDGLRLCAARIARSMYTLRNKRNILHKGDVDPNGYDLAYLHHAAQWIMAELLRAVTGHSMEKAGELIAQVQAPAGSMIEDIDGKRIVLHDLPVADEVLVLLQSHHPNKITVADVVTSLDRRNPAYVGQKLRALWAAKKIEGDGRTGYRLTHLGLERVKEILRQHAEG